MPKEHYPLALAIIGNLSDADSPPTQAFSYIPLLKWENVESWCTNPKQWKELNIESWLPAPLGAKKHSFALQVNNKVMVSPSPGELSYLPGSIIFVDPNKPPTADSRVIASIGGIPIFREYTEELGKKYLIPLNPAYETVEVDENCRIYGCVVGSYHPE